MVEFEVFVRELARAFEAATDRKAKVTWNPRDDRYEGQSAECEAPGKRA
jgi:hypothetical protein